MSKMYYYHVIPADTTSPKVTLTQKELYGLEKTLSQEACDYYRAEDTSMKAQRAIATLISISYHCLGGNDPCHLTHKQKGKKRSQLLQPRYRFDYLSYFVEELVKMMPKFQRSKGCWTQYVLWARGKGMRRIIQQIKRENKQDELLNDLISALDLMGTFCQIDEDLIEQGMYNDEEFEKDLEDMDVDMAV